MNIVISNIYQSMLQGLDIDAMQKLDGEFDADEIVRKFKNVYFNKLILDVTAIKNYKNTDEIQKISLGLDPTKVILFLDDSIETTSSKYLSEIIGMGIYNFATSINGIIYLYNNPNSYKDVAYIRGGA